MDALKSAKIHEISGGLGTSDCAPDSQGNCCKYPFDFLNPFVLMPRPPSRYGSPQSATESIKLRLGPLAAAWWTIDAAIASLAEFRFDADGEWFTRIICLPSQAP
jgi:hypothetical protein